ncbi:MAG: HAD-IC family P-type ATPase, partial [Chloroflexi bacterium]|nr:HAD-IC family P-type ATPase [Chloroflexota bacterium]
MKILMLAPEPFFESRGTPISVLGRLRALSTLGHEVDLVTYHLGENVSIPGMTIHRIPRVPLVRSIKVGPSFIKPFLDVLLFAKAIRLLKRAGVRVVMLTGDSLTTAQAVARELGLDEVHADVLPEQKTELIRRLQDEGHTVAMAGDGVNDAPALAQAHVGIAMGTGADVAMESAGVTLVKGDLRGIVRARRLSQATM